MQRRPFLLSSAAPLLGWGLLGHAPSQAADERTTIAGIKEALAVGTEKAVKSLGREDGYYTHAVVKILLPSSVQKLADVARKAGFSRQVDELVLGMNRAAEQAAPLAASHFANAIRGMGMRDVQAILKAGDTGATAFFERTTRTNLYAAFKPSVTQSIERVGASRAYKNLMERAQRVPLLGAQSFDLDEHVTNKALDGLFFVVGEEEKKIRRDPLARTSSVLKAVFGR
jgi:hypothetical protein